MIPEPYVPKPSDYTEYVGTEDGGAKKKHYPAQASWEISTAIPSLNGRYVFTHTCTADLSYKQLYATEGDKEFGMGFYTCCGSSEIPHKLIAGDWFEAKQKRHDWHVIAFSIKASGLVDYLLQNAGDQKLKLSVALGFYLSNSNGYPSGQANPTIEDFADINAINLLGRVLILPSNKDLAVSVFGGETKTWTQFTAGKGGGGPYILVIGPQQPEIMLDHRQYCWTPGWGIYFINCAARYYHYRNYQIFGKDDGMYRAALKGQWPGDHPKTRPDGSKF